MNKKYYRIVKVFKGERNTFIPTKTYEALAEINGEIIISNKNNKGLRKYKEVCFSENIVCCFYSISMFMNEGDTYYIYETNQNPCLEAYKCKEGDFKASREVRYRVPVDSVYIGKFKVHKHFLEAIQELYGDFMYGEYFDSDSILDIIDNNYNSLYNEIIYHNPDIESRFSEKKLSSDEYEAILEIRELESDYY